MGSPLRIDVITIFPGMLRGFVEESMLKRASEKGAIQLRMVDPRDFTTDRHRTVDDRPYGGGPGMIMKPEPLFAALESVLTPEAYVVLMTPQGRTFDQAIALDLVRRAHLVFVCGHYEGVDERVRERFVHAELSVGDYILTNGVLPAAVVIDAVVRLLPGVLGGGEQAVTDETFSCGGLEYPQYTRPAEYRGMKVPEVLLSGHHGEIEHWRERQAEARTRERRPDLIERNRTAGPASVD